ncbi:MAG: hypothetical protein GF418_08380 [Chitinivibrionales bacterium]|nr:hypothetical protein [Chitinivibrionales bacterium]MBD3395630.1 hypothetical protein [Chitinivibrionales bacterium]
MKTDRHPTIDPKPQKHSILGHTLFLVLLSCGLVSTQARTSIGPSPYSWHAIEISDTLTLYVKDQRVGTLFHRIEVDSSDACVRVTKEVVVGHGGGGLTGVAPAMSVTEIREYEYTAALRRVFQELASPSGTTTWHLDRGSDSTWRLRTTAGGESTVREISRVASSLRTTYDIQTAILDGTAEEGQTWVDSMFDVMSGRMLVVRTRCIAVPGESTAAWEFVNIDNVMSREERWKVDRRGRTMYMEVAPIFVARREKCGREGGGDTAFADITRIAESFTIPKERLPRKNETIALTFDSLAHLHESVRGMYAHQNGSHVLKALADTCLTAKSGTRTVKDSAYLRATAAVQANAKAVQDLATRLTRGRSDICDITGALTDYMFTNIEKRAVATFSSALETLNAGFGDCGEHAVLLAALLRASGIPARVVYGLVFVGPQRGYMYHAWVQARGEKWVGADPALGVFPAWRGYVPLIIDDTGENTVHLANIIDRISIRYVPSP